MATRRELAARVLRKLMVLAAGETASAEDQQLAEEKLEAVHAALQVDGLARWTLQDIPKFAEEPYVMMAAFLGARDFGQPADGTLWAQGLGQIQAGVALGSGGPICTEYF